MGFFSFAVSGFGPGDGNVNGRGSLGLNGWFLGRRR